MSYGKNVKRSVTYEFELNNSKILAPMSRYKGYSKLYQLNLSKMLLKCPDSPFLKKDQPLTNPEQLLVVSTQKFNCSQRIKNTISIKCQSDLSRNKVQSLKRNIKDNLINEDLQQFKQQTQSKGAIEDNNRTTVSPKNPRMIEFPLPLNQSARSSIKFIKNQFFKVARKKMIDFTVVNYAKQSTPHPEKEKKQPNDLEAEQLEEKAQSSTISDKKYTIKRKISFNVNNQVLQRSKLSKKLLLPEIKPSPEKSQAHTYNVASRSNIPVLFRDPQQLKQIKAESYAITEYPSGSLVLSNKGCNQYEIASLTKIMTFYTTMKIVNKYSLSIREEKIKITDVAMDMSGTSAEILSGEVYTVEELLYGMMLPSGNDAATALAEWGGKHLIKNHHHPNHINIHFSTEDNAEPEPGENPSTKSRLKTFIQEMNLNAKELGLSSTRFANPHGLPHSEAKSTAIDVTRLCFECLKDDFFRKVVSTHSFKCTPYQTSNHSLKRNVEWKNTNKLLRREGFIGIKTGITVTAGPCLASAFKFRDKIYICVVLRATKVSRRFKETRKLLAWSLEKLYKDSLTAEQAKLVGSLKKNKPDLDSDYSEDEQEFNYDQSNKAEFKKRSNIINYEM